MFKEIVTVCTKNHTKSIHTKCNVNDLKYMVHIVTIHF
jgi:hypothetical protein